MRKLMDLKKLHGNLKVILNKELVCLNVLYGKFHFNQLVLSLLIIIFVFPFKLKAQIGQNVNSEGIECRVKDYKFLIEGNYYFEHNRKSVYVCPKNLPVDITVVNALDQMPVSSMFTWLINDNISSESSNTISIDNLDFDGNESELVVDFIETSTGNTISMSLLVNKNIKLSFEEDDLTTYQYDDNAISDYIISYLGTEKVGTPWNFIESGSLDILNANVSKKKGKYAVSNILSNNLNLNISPNIMSTSSEDITFNFSGTNQNIIEVLGCHESDPELLLFTENSKSYNIEFIRVCETDDDVPLYCPNNRTLQNDCITPITSPDYICIDGGVDKTIDEMLKRTLTHPSQRVIEAMGDELKSINDTYYVIAGSNNKCDVTSHPAGPPNVLLFLVLLIH